MVQQLLGEGYNSQDVQNVNNIHSYEHLLLQEIGVKGISNSSLREKRDQKMSLGFRVSIKDTSTMVKLP